MAELFVGAVSERIANVLRSEPLETAINYGQTTTNSAIFDLSRAERHCLSGSLEQSKPVIAFISPLVSVA